MEKVLAFFLVAAAAYVALAAAAVTVDKACNGTLYPDVCKSALWPFSECLSQSQDPARHMAMDVVAVASDNAQLLSSWAQQVHRMGRLDPRDQGPMADCAELLDDAKAQIQESLATLKKMQAAPPSDPRQLSDVRTWLSAALTDYDTCLDGFAEARRKESFVMQLMDVQVGRSSALASVSLALLNIPSPHF